MNKRGAEEGGGLGTLMAIILILAVGGLLLFYVVPKIRTASSGIGNIAQDQLQLAIDGCKNGLATEAFCLNLKIIGTDTYATCDSSQIAAKISEAKPDCTSYKSDIISACKRLTKFPAVVYATGKIQVSVNKSADCDTLYGTAPAAP